MENQEAIKNVEVSKAIELLKGLQNDERVDETETAKLKSTLGTLGKLFQDLDPKEQQRIEVEITVSFKPFKITISAKF